jgi:cytidine deaminase
VIAGATLEDDLRAIVERRPDHPADGSVILAAVADELVAGHGLASVEALALAALPLAEELSNPPISGFRVPAVGIEAASGDLVLGGNLEFAGTELGTTVHAEGFVSLRARRRGHSLATLVVREARPCAHCRQTLSEAANAAALVLVDAVGNRRTLDDIYPWPFRPEALGIAGDDPAIARWPGLALADGGAPGDVTALLLEVGRHAHVPYSKAPSAVVLRLADGRVLGAGAVESVSFNPSISAAQAALVEVAAVRSDPAEVADAWLARQPGGAIDPEPGFRALVGAVAPGARLGVLDWAGQGW